MNILRISLLHHILLVWAALSIGAPVGAQQTANDYIPPYTGGFRAGANPGAVPPFTDESLAELAAGSDAKGIPGVGARALRPGLSAEFLETYGYDIRLDAFEYYDALGMKDHTAIVGFPPPARRDPTEYCPGIPSTLFANMYEPIWDNNNGTPVNENNYAAKYFYEMAQRYSPYIRFWEIWNEPGFDYTSLHGYLEPGTPGNWWDADPSPCDYKLRAPIQHYVRLLRIAYEVIKSVDPNGYILCGGVGYPSFLDAILRNTDNPNGGAITADFPLKGGAYFDAVGYHSYPHFDASTQEYNDTTQMFDYFRHSDGAAAGILKVKDRFLPVLQAHGYDGTTYPAKLWSITEINVPRKGFQYLMGGDLLQRNFMIKAYVTCLREQFTQMHVYSLSEGTAFDQATFEFDVMGLYKKLKYQDGTWQARNEEGIALKTASDLLFGKTFDANRTAALNLPSSIGGGAFKDAAGNYTYVLWAKTTQDLSENAQGFFTFPAAFQNNYHIRRDWDFAATGVQNPIDAHLPLALTATPVFISQQFFSQNNTAVCAPATVQFNQQNPGLPIATRLWTFENGVPNSSSQQNPSVVFSTPGTHAISLKLYNALGALIGEQTGVVEVGASPTASFDIQAQGGLLFFHNNSSFNSGQFQWNFGDGQSSTEANPVHFFAQDGDYTVQLTASNGCGSHTAQKSVFVNAPAGSVLTYSADDSIAVFNGNFRPGVSIKYVNGWTDEQQADIAAGNASVQQPGAGVKTLKTVLPQYFMDYWGYDIRKSTFQHFDNLDLQGNIALLGYPNPQVQDSFPWCATATSNSFKNLYSDIWDGGANGTPINEANPFAKYVWNTVKTYKPYVRFWQLYDSPDYDATGDYGWLPPGEPGNWWDFNPDPCVLNSHAPIQIYIRMLRITYEIVKTLDPDAYVLLGSLGYPSYLDALLRNTDNPLDGATTADFPKKGGAYFDAIAFNTYPFVDGSTSGYDNTLGQVVYKRHSDAAITGIDIGKQKFSAVLEAHGYNGTLHPAKQWVIAESNTPRLSFGQYFGGDEAQKNYFIKAITVSMAKGFLMYNANALAEAKPYGEAQGPDDLMGLYAYLGGANPYNSTLNIGGIAYKTTSDLLYKTSFDPVKTAAMAMPAGTEGFAFKDPSGHYIYVVWAKTQYDNLEFASGSYSFPASFNISSLYKKEWNWSASHTQTTTGPTDIALSATPYFLTETEFPVAFPVAAFAADVTNPCAGAAVQFQNNSQNGSSFQWHFEGGVPEFSTETNPVVHYPTPGLFTVTLTANNSAGADIQTELSFIQVKTIPVADIQVSTDGPVVHFKNNSSGNFDGVKWIFNNGDIEFAWEFDKTFYSNGNYQVTFIALNGCGADTLLYNFTINAPAHAVIDYHLPTQCNFYYVSFESKSTGQPLQLQWHFPGGSPEYSTEVYPYIQYPGPGSYSAELIADNGWSSDTASFQFDLMNSVYFPLEMTVCPGFSIEIAGQVFDQIHPMGQALFPNGSYLGCDSVVLVNLDFLPPIQTTIADTIPFGGSFNFCGETLQNSGTYTCTLQDIHGCDSIITLLLNVLSETKTPESAMNFAVFPNPTAGIIEIETDFNQAETGVFQWFNGNGQQVLTDFQAIISAGKQRRIFHLTALPSGIYWIRWKGSHRSFQQRVIKLE